MFSVYLYISFKIKCMFSVQNTEYKKTILTVLICNIKNIMWIELVFKQFSILSNLNVY